MIAGLNVAAAPVVSRAAREDISLVPTMAAVVSFSAGQIVRKKPTCVTINKNTHDEGR
jgi:hypothetical protein